MFIAIEGIDRSGKSTQATKLSSALAGSKLYRFPERDQAPTGHAIDAYLRGLSSLTPREAHLLFVSNRKCRRADIESASNDVIVDRWSYSGIAYAAAEQHADMSWDWLHECEADLPLPDIVVYLEIDPDVASRRGGFGTERYDDVSVLRKVAANFRRLMASDKSGRWHVVDATLPEEEVHAKILAIVQKHKEASRGYGKLTDVSPVAVH